MTANKVVTRFLERELKDPKPGCTDCHGMRRTEHAEEEALAAEEASLPATPESTPKSEGVKTLGS